MSDRVGVEYHMVKTLGYVEDSGLVASYGIRCESKPEGGKQGTVCRVVPDISTDPAFVEELVRRLMMHKADPAHLLDLIEDYIG